MSNIKIFFKENFSVIITGIVSIAAVFVSIAQVWVASIDKEKEIVLSNVNAAKVRKLDEIKATRAWKLDLANFMAKHRKEIYSEGKEGVQLKQIMLATFPPEVTSNVFGSLSRFPDDGSNWAEAKITAQMLQQPSTKVFFEKSFPIKILDAMADTIAEGGEIAYPYEDHLIPEGLTTGDVRYFSASDKKLAEQVKKDFEQLACFEGYKISLKLIPLTESKTQAPLRFIEVWLSGKSIIGRSNEKDC